MSITVELDAEAVTERLTRLATAVGPQGMEPFFARIGEFLAETTRRRFVTSTAPDGQPWAPNAPATYLGLLRRRERDGARLRRGDGRINAGGVRTVARKRPLVDTGELAEQGIAYQLVPDGVLVGTNRFANEWAGGAAVHQFGSRDGRIPARPFLGLSAEDERAVSAMLDDWLREAAGG